MAVPSNVIIKEIFHFRDINVLNCIPQKMFEVTFLGDTHIVTHGLVDFLYCMEDSESSANLVTIPTSISF